MVVVTLTLRSRQTSLPAPSRFMSGLGQSFERGLTESGARLGDTRAADLSAAELARQAHFAELRDRAAKFAKRYEFLDKFSPDSNRPAELRRDERLQKFRQAELDRQAELVHSALAASLLQLSHPKLLEELKTLFQDAGADAYNFALDLERKNTFLLVDLMPYMTEEYIAESAEELAEMGLDGGGESERYMIGFFADRLSSNDALYTAIDVRDSTFDTAKYDGSPDVPDWVVDRREQYKTKASILEKLVTRMNEADKLKFSGDS